MFHRRGRGAAARTGRERGPGPPEAQQRGHLAGPQGERRAPAPAGDEDQDEDQQGGGGETRSAQTGEEKAPGYSCGGCRLPLVQQLWTFGKSFHSRIMQRALKLLSDS